MDKSAKADIAFIMTNSQKTYKAARYRLAAHGFVAQN
jgi:hypothetical protein